MIANPTADSAAATVRIKKEKIWPYISSKYTENKIKLRLNDNRTNSKQIRM